MLERILRGLGEVFLGVQGAIWGIRGQGRKAPKGIKGIGCLGRPGYLGWRLRLSVKMHYSVFFSDRGQDGALRGALNKPFLISLESLLKALVACDRGPPMAAHNCSLEPFLEGRAHSKVV